MMAPLPPPPAPPPPPMNLPGGPNPASLMTKTSPSKPPSVAGDRNALLQQIRSGAKLKKAVTNDRSQPLIDGKANQSSNSSPRVGGAGTGPGFKSNGGPPLGALFSSGMPKLRSVGSKTAPTRDDGGNSINRTNSSQSSPTSGTLKKTANSTLNSTQINKSPINSNFIASLEAQFNRQHQNGTLRNGSGTNSLLNNNDININLNATSKFNTISSSRNSQWKVSPGGNSTDASSNECTLTPYSKGPAPSVPSSMGPDSFKISAQLNSLRPSINRSKSVGLKPSQRPTPPSVKPPPPPKTISSNNTNITVNVAFPSNNSSAPRRTSLDPSSVAEEGSSHGPSHGCSSNKPPPPPRNLPVTHGPPPPLHGRATGNPPLSSGLSKSQSSINGPSRPSAPPPPPPPFFRNPANVSVSSSNLLHTTNTNTTSNTILKPSYPAPPPPAPSLSSNRSSFSSTGQVTVSAANSSRMDLATRFDFKDPVILPRPDPMTKTNKQYASVIHQAKQQSRESAHHC